MKTKTLVLFTGLLFFVALGFFFFSDFKPQWIHISSVQEPKIYQKVDPANHLLLKELRKRIHQNKPIQRNDGNFNKLFQRTNFPKQFHGFAMILYQPGEKRILAVRRAKSDFENIRQVVNQTILHSRINDFDLTNTETCRIQIDFILHKPQPLSNSTTLSLSSSERNQFEFGIDGLRISDGKKVQYFLPGDAFVRSILGLNQLKHYVRKLYPGIPIEKLNFERIQTSSYVSYQDRWIPLYRGYPVLGNMGAGDLKNIAEAGVNYAINHQKDDGRFLYYYDAAKDSFKDHEHPTRDPLKNPYYNSLRHSGGALLLLHHYRLYQNERVIPSVKAAIDFMIQHLERYETPEGHPAAYVFYNQKAKLGGSGLALFLLAEYQHLTGDATYQDEAKLLKEHLLSEIQDSGEFFYYHIYPGREKRDPRSFSFYYPGEALIGLASYYKSMAQDDEKKLIQEKIHRALQFLLFQRPVVYKDHFQSLPSDSWLMMAINELWDIPEMQKPEYKEFVFQDADKMVHHMYTAKDALYPDYVGSFYYQYGDHPYPDGARAEGLMGALELAHKTESETRIKRYREALKALSWATMHLANIPESTYSVPNPQMALGGIRFKLTRQWFRIDTIQHVASAYLKFLPYWKKGDLFNPKEFRQ